MAWTGAVTNTPSFLLNAILLLAATTNTVLVHAIVVKGTFRMIAAAGTNLSFDLVVQDTLTEESSDITDMLTFALGAGEKGGLSLAEGTIAPHPKLVAGIISGGGARLWPNTKEGPWG